MRIEKSSRHFVEFPIVPVMERKTARPTDSDSIIRRKLDAQSFCRRLYLRRVRYDCVADPIAMRNCHCRDCQRAIGQLPCAALLVPASAESITGEPKYYDVT